MEASSEMAEVHGPYETYDGCPVSKGIFQYDMWDVTPTNLSLVTRYIIIEDVLFVFVTRRNPQMKFYSPYILC